MNKNIGTKKISIMKSAIKPARRGWVSGLRREIKPKIATDNAWQGSANISDEP